MLLHKLFHNIKLTKGIQMPSVLKWANKENQDVGKIATAADKDFKAICQHLTPNYINMKKEDMDHYLDKWHIELSDAIFRELENSNRSPSDKKTLPWRTPISNVYLGDGFPRPYPILGISERKDRLIWSLKYAGYRGTAKSDSAYDEHDIALAKAIYDLQLLSALKLDCERAIAPENGRVVSATTKKAIFSKIDQYSANIIQKINQQIENDSKRESNQQRPKSTYTRKNLSVLSIIPAAFAIALAIVGGFVGALILCTLFGPIGLLVIAGAAAVIGASVGYMYYMEHRTDSVKMYPTAPAYEAIESIAEKLSSKSRTAPPAERSAHVGVAAEKSTATGVSDRDHATQTTRLPVEELSPMQKYLQERDRFFLRSQSTAEYPTTNAKSQVGNLQPASVVTAAAYSSAP
jgi:hypothetical protein